MSESLYFIAVLPPQKIQEEITLLKQEIAEHFGSKHALKSPPHITIHMPFKWKDKRYSELEQVMNDINSDLEPFQIELKNFDFFEPRVVFVDVVPNEALDALQHKVVDACKKTLKLDNANYKDRAFHPHVTIGFRDLKKTRFYEAKKVFEQRTIGFAFDVSNISLLKHDGTRWNVVEF